MSEPHAEIPIRPAVMDDAESIADILGEAFAADPVMSWVMGGQNRARGLFFNLAKNHYLKSGFGHIAEDKGATLWLPADAALKPSWLAELQIAWATFKAGGVGAMRRGLAAQMVMAKNHPASSHSYLFAVGVRAEGRGKGLGGRLIREGLSQARKGRADAYLENSNPKNTPLYLRLGFEVERPLILPEGAPPLLAMVRSAEAQ